MTATALGVLRRERTRRSVALLVGLAALIAVSVLSVMVGARDISPADVWSAVIRPGASHESLVLWESRIPRTITGLIVGPALGVCGALIQAFTRNPLADPGILGVNAGAGFAIALGVGVLGVSRADGYIWFALVGALLATIAVYLIGGAGGGASPERVTLAGVALTALLGGIATGIELKNRDAFTGLRFWGVGSLAGHGLADTVTIAPFIAVGLILAVVLAKSLNVLALGDDLGRSLGSRVRVTRVATILAVTLLAGGATAIAGPIAFVGLMIPHVVRWFTGPDQRWIIPFSMVAAAILLLASDIVARVVLPSGELRVGIVTALIGAPVLAILVRRRQASGL